MSCTVLCCCCPTACPPPPLCPRQVGGLGLNLTAADTVIFLEHDWNPMNDLQVGAGGLAV